MSECMPEQANRFFTAGDAQRGRRGIVQASAGVTRVRPRTGSALRRSGLAFHDSGLSFGCHFPVGIEDQEISGRAGGPASTIAKK